MALSVIEIMEEDCGTTSSLKVKIISKNHILTLIGKWFKVFETDLDWLLLEREDQVKVDDMIFVRSPIYCLTANKKICQRCFGVRSFNTKYLGILSGQILSERFTQLTLRSFHDSGSATLQIDLELKNFIRNHLIDIKYAPNSNIVSLIFDTSIIVDFSTLSNYHSTNQDIVSNQPSSEQSTPSIQSTTHKVNFTNTLETQQNSDSIESLKKFKEILRVAKTNIKHPNQYYSDLMKLLLTIGSAYSSFVELLLTNMFVTDIKLGKLWRHNQSDSIQLKLGDKTLANNTSKLLGLLYQQNSKTIENIEDLDNYLNKGNLTIYEKIFLEKF